MVDTYTKRCAEQTSETLLSSWATTPLATSHRSTCTIVVKILTLLSKDLDSTLGHIVPCIPPTYHQLPPNLAFSLCRLTVDRLYPAYFQY